jgi:hypothetical protein
MRLVIFCVLMVGLLAGAGAVLAASPNPVQVNIVINPPTAHVGDAVTFRCEFIPLGNIYPLVEVSASYPGKNVGAPRVIRRSFGQNGAYVWAITFIAERSDPVTCSAKVSIDGVLVITQASAMLEVLP